MGMRQPLKTPCIVTLSPSASGHGSCRMGWRRRGAGRLKEHRQPSRDNMGQELDTEFQTGDCLEVEFEATDSDGT